MVLREPMSARRSVLHKHICLCLHESHSVCFRLGQVGLVQAVMCL